MLPRHNASMVVVAAILHIALFALVTEVRTRPVRVRTAGAPTAGISAWISGPAAVMPATVVPAKSPEPETALKTELANDAPKEETVATQALGSAAIVGAGQPGSGPVRLGGTGGDITLIKKVQPVYPAVMQAARVTGQVVLDAIINPDGTIGEVKVLSTTNEAFAQSAVEAVKRWRYAALGFRGILTVTVNFTLT